MQDVSNEQARAEAAIDAAARERLDSCGEHIAQFFAWEHLPPHLQEVSKPFAMLACGILDLPRNPERTVALRELLRAKDAAVRARIAKG